MTPMQIPPPDSDEFGPYYGRYIQRVPPGSDLFALLAAQPEQLRTCLSAVADAQASVRPALTEWSIKEIIGHLNDGERILAYRALCIARGDITPLPGFEQDDYVSRTDFNQRTLADLIEEFSDQRRANVRCFRSLSQAELMRCGTASDSPFSVRALLYIMAGHVMHHIESLKVDYRVSA